MNKNHRITLNTNKNIIVEFTNERIIPAAVWLLRVSSLEKAISSKTQSHGRDIQPVSASD